MVKRKMSQTAVWNRLKELEKLQSAQNAVDVLFVRVEENGQISVGEAGKKKYFEDMFAVDNYILTLPGVTGKTTIFLDDLSMWGDLYLPNDPLWYYVTANERKRFIDTKDQADWLRGYINVINNLLSKAVGNPSMFLPGFNDPALKDLIANRNEYTVTELVDRYNDQRWFKGNKK